MDSWRQAGTAKLSGQLNCSEHSSRIPSPPATHGKCDKMNFRFALRSNVYQRYPSKNELISSFLIAVTKRVNSCCVIDCFVNSLRKVCWRTLLCGVVLQSCESSGWKKKKKKRNSFLTLPLLLLHSYHHLLLTSRVNRAYIPLAALSWDVSSSTSSYLMFYFCTILLNSHTLVFFFTSTASS